MKVGDKVYFVTYNSDEICEGILSCYPLNSLVCIVKESDGVASVALKENTFKNKQKAVARLKQLTNLLGK